MKEEKHIDDQRMAAIIGANIRYYLTRNNLPRKQLAEQLNVSLSSVAYWCTGTRMPHMNNIEKMCEIFGCSKNEILTDRDLYDPSALTNDEFFLVCGFRQASPELQETMLFQARIAMQNSNENVRDLPARSEQHKYRASNVYHTTNGITISGNGNTFLDKNIVYPSSTHCSVPEDDQNEPNNDNHGAEVLSADEPGTNDFSTDHSDSDNS